MEDETKSSVFDYPLNAKVRIGARVAGEEKGIVIGHAEYLDAPPAYYVAYVDGNCNYRKDWFGSEDLQADPG